MAADGTPRITWHGKDFATTTEIVRLGEIEVAVQVPDLSDPWLRRFYAALIACERIEGANRIAPAHVLETVGCRYLEEGGTIESWHQYETELGISPSKTRPPRSQIQPVMKWIVGGMNDRDGRIGRLSAAFDAWLAVGQERPDPTPRNGEPGTSRLAEWLADHGGYQAVAKAHNARLEYEAALKRGTVWVTHADGTERVYDSKAAAESQNEGSAYEEPAEWWDLEGCEPTGVGEYRRIDPETDDEDESDPIPERIKGVVRPEHHPRSDDQKNYSESKSETTTARKHHPWDYATHNKKYALLIPPASEEWYAPPQLFQAMDCTFDLDPASPGADVVHWIPARRHFTRSDNGLEQDWGDDFVWLSAPYTKENLPLWLEKFRKHANGVCLTVDRTSARWWQELCANADLILQVNKKIHFLRPPDEPSYSSPALGHTLVAYGPRGVAALRNAARNGLGTIFVPMAKSEARLAELEEELARLKDQRDRAEEPKQESKRSYKTPRPLYEVLDRTFAFDFDAAPYPRPEGYDSLVVPWGQSSYSNGPFSAKRNPEKHGPADFSRKSIAENRLGKNVVIVVPTMNYINMLLEAGAEPFAIGRVPWEDAETGEPHPSPPYITGFVLWGRQYTAPDRVAIMAQLKREIAKLNY